MKFPKGRYWWMATNPDDNAWKLLDQPVGVEEYCTKFNDNGNAKTSAGAFDEIAVGDWILGYVGGRQCPHGVYSLLQCTRALTDKKWRGEEIGPHYRFKKVCDLEQYIPWEVFSKNPILQQSHMVSIHNAGSLFGFDAGQQRELLKVLNRFRGRRYWTYTPGSSARGNWDFNADIKDRVMGLGQDALGDLHEYGNAVKRLARDMRKHYAVEGDGSGNARYMLAFRDEMHPGDVIFVKRGKHRFAGVGIVTGDYRYDRRRKESRQVRDVKWIRHFDREAPCVFGITTLAQLSDRKKIAALLKVAELSVVELDQYVKLPTVTKLSVKREGPEPKEPLSWRQSITDPKTAKVRLAQIRRTERLRETLQREGQDVLRAYLLGKRGRCAVTGLSIPSLLVASHIKDWSACTRDERLDEENVLLLAKNVDAAFDRKLISFDSAGRIVKSDAVSWNDLKLLGIAQSACIPHPRGRQADFLAWHRERLQRLH